MKILFRTDSSLRIGSGHVMRCLTLAEILRQHGAVCRFICRDHPGNLIELIRQQGFMATTLARSPTDIDATTPGHTAWLGCDWHTDVVETRTALSNDRPDWLIVDHYALDQQWENALRDHCGQIMVIDDLADRAHDCDLLLDQNLGREPADYADLVPSDCTVIVGPDYALLRPEFAALRDYSLQRRKHPRLENLLISMGGIDTHNATGRVLEALKRCPLPADCRIMIVAGLRAPWLNQIRELSRQLPWQCEIKSDTRNMAQLMADSDLAVGGAGSTSWERCALGLPSFIAILAENQLGASQALAKAGAARLLGDVDGIRESIPKQFSGLTGSALAEMSNAAKMICDGRGTLRAVRTMFRTGCHVRSMREDDLDMVLRWRNHPNVRRFMHTQHEISLSEHRTWYLQTLQNQRRHLLIVESGDSALGFVQFTQLDDQKVAEWGFYKAPDAPVGSGTKLCIAALEYAFRQLHFSKVIGKVISSNKRSLAFHLKLGFIDESKSLKHCVNHGDNDTECQFGLLAKNWL